jgi:hypothetical protein
VADVGKNPYDSIVNRNPFGLKPPPPPVDPSSLTPPPPPAPPSTVELTGVTSILNSKRALLEITPGPGKPVVRTIMQEGDRLENVEVVSIDVNKNEVQIKNGLVTTNLTFKVIKSTATAAAAPPPGLPAAGLPHPATPPPQAASPYNSGGRNNVMVAGGTPPPVVPNSPVVNPNVPYSGNAAFGGQSAGAQPTVAGGADPNFRSIPARNIRTTTPQGDVSREQQYLMMEVNREINSQAQDPTGKRGSFPLPPTPLNPNPTPHYPPLPGQVQPQQ